MADGAIRWWQTLTTVDAGAIESSDPVVVLPVAAIEQHGPHLPLSTDLEIGLAGDMLVKVDRMSMANSLEVRSPFLDRELVELAFKLPGKYKVGMFKGKKILREVFSDRLPEWSINLPKKGFEVPIASWLSKDLKSLLNKTCNSKNLEKIGIVNTSIVENWKKNLFAGKKDTSWQLWTLLAYDQWLKARGLV